ncbi:cobyric acid synthase [Pelobacter propionicus]|uniref:Cobyric acid synthase n=1 Tax=Pelobacter propionicus (strain DSM 2379 / NBRC 103807 / OttBd1) TaxID=338966 RepID=A1AMD0_PELPD|nr:cobyric acid synthase [Pelobacter propionicus]ABK98500.1 adenosylcobyric acid synthase (glutamine-hydrolysing) [Pelobacter propionicus DSM 2379]
MASLYIIGSGPGAVEHLTDAARQAIAASTVIVGYDNYIEQIRSLIQDRQTVATGMMREVERCREAIHRARQGETVCLVSGGDAGIYGMAGLVFELLESETTADAAAPQPDVRVIPGISAVQAAASVLGAPLMHDFSVISLSDLLTPWELIRCRLEAAARADFVIALYNPRSKSRVTQIEEAARIILASRPPETPAGIVRNACRHDQNATVTTLGELLSHDIDMSTIVIIGNASSFIDSRGRMVTPRGYARKYVDAASPLTATPPDGPLPDGRALMFCGTASDVGKSILTAGFCRSLIRRGLTVAPFKSQNMSNNSFVTAEGGEVGRAQAMQAQACNIPPHTDMNPVLLKPNSDTGSQVVVQGRPVANMNVREYDSYKPQALERIRESFQNLRQAYEFIVLEGAGSISEINLKDNDIANLKIALMARCPVILVADIDRGGVFAQIAGTLDLLDPLERYYIKGVIINKFRGDASILTPGIDFIQERTGVPVLGVLPWLSELCLPAEDSVILSQEAKMAAQKDGRQIRIGIIRLPRISNFTDFDQLHAEADVILSYVRKPEQLEELDVLIIPGSKSTIGDLLFLKEEGLLDAIAAFRGRIIGICGGYQMLGQRVLDPQRVESSLPEAEGLALLPVETTMLLDKETHQAWARLEQPGRAIAPDCDGELSGYEIHMGRTDYLHTPRPFARIFRRGDSDVDIQDGCVSQGGRVFGTYLHGIFDNARFRDSYLNAIRSEKGMPLQREETRQPVSDPFDLLSCHMERHLDMPKLLEICGLPRDPA